MVTAGGRCATQPGAATVNHPKTPWTALEATEAQRSLEISIKNKAEWGGKRAKFHFRGYVAHG